MKRRLTRHPRAFLVECFISNWSSFRTSSPSPVLWHQSWVNLNSALCQAQIAAASPISFHHRHTNPLLWEIQAIFYSCHIPLGQQVLPCKHFQFSHLYTNSGFELWEEVWVSNMTKYFYNNYLGVIEFEGSDFRSSTQPEKQPSGLGRLTDSHRCFLCGANLNSLLSSVTTMPEAGKILQQKMKREQAQLSPWLPWNWSDVEISVKAP